MQVSMIQPSILLDDSLTFSGTDHQFFVILISQALIGAPMDT
jgi:hypothetical protein